MNENIKTQEEILAVLSALESELAQTKEALRKAEQKFHFVADFSTDWEYWIDRGGKFVYISPACEQLTGYTPEEFINDPDLLIRIIHPDDKNLMSSADQSIDVRHSRVIDFRIIDKNGKVHWIGHNCRPIFDSHGKSLGVRVSNRDISERIANSQALEKSEKRYRKLIESMNEGVLVVDSQRNITYVNDSLCDLIGYSREELVGRTLWSLFNEKDLEIVTERAIIKDSKDPRPYEISITRKDGKKVHTLSAPKRIFDGEGNYVSSIVVFTDITNRKEAEIHRLKSFHDSAFLSSAALEFVRESQDGNIFEFISREIYALAGEGFVIVSEYDSANDKTIVRAISGSLSELSEMKKMLDSDPVGLEYKVADEFREQMLTEGFMKIPGGLHILSFRQIPEDLARTIEERLNIGDIYVMPFVTEGDFLGTVALISHAGMTPENMNLMKAFVHQAAVALQRRRAFAALKEAELEIRRNQTQLEDFMDSATDLFVILDAKMNFVNVNKCTLEFMKLKKEDVIGKNILDIMPELKETERYNIYRKVLETGIPFYIKEVEPNPKFGNNYLEVKVFKAGNGIGIVSRDITERRRSEKERANLLLELGQKKTEIEDLAEKMRRERDILDVIMDNTGAHLAYLDIDFNFVKVNSTYAKTNGYLSEQMVGLNHFELFPHEENEAIFRRVRDTGQAAEFRAKPFEFKDHPEWGTTYWDWTLIPVKDDKNIVQGLVLSLQDVTDRVRMTDEIRQAEERYRTVANFTSDWEYWRGPDGKFIYVSPACEKTTGYKSEEFLADPHLLEQIVHPEDQEYVNKHIHEMSHGNEETGIDFRIIDRAGTIHWIGHLCQPVYGDDGKYLGIRATNRDITERKKTEEALRRSEDRFAKAFRSSPAALSITQLEEGRFVDVNDALINLFGYSKDELIGHTSLELGIFSDPENRVNLVRKLTENGVVRNYEMTVRTSSGRLIETLFSTELIELNGKPHILSILFDITERKRFEEELRRSEERYSLAQQAAKIGSWDWNISNGKLEWSEEVERMFGLEMGTFGNSFDSFLELIHPEDRTQVTDALNTSVEESKEIENEFRISLSDGSIRWLFLKGNIIGHENGRPSRMLGIIQDITSRKRIENLLRSRTLELAAANRELEAFTYSASHDLRAPLRTVDGFSQALLEDYGDKLDDEGKEFIMRVRSATQRMGTLIDSLLSLSRIAKAEMRVARVDLSSMARSILHELQESESERLVEIIIQDKIFANGDSQLLRVLLQNLLGNAWKFTGKKQRGIIEFGVIKDMGQSIYYIRDNGAGFDMHYASKLFVPFQRLHSVGEFSGNGVGLAIAQRITNRHGGRIWAESEMDKGSTFYFTL